MKKDSPTASEKFERRIDRIHQLIEQPGSEITWDDHLPDPDNPTQPRQIDVSVKRDGKLTLIECRIHKNRQDVQWIEELIGRRLSLRADAAIAVSASGFTRGAIVKAKAFGIILRDFETLTKEEISSWGHLAQVSLTFHEFKRVQLDFRFESQFLGEIDVDRVEEDLRGSPSKLYGVFETVAEKFETDNPMGRPCRFTADVGRDGLQVAGRPVARIGFSADITRQKRAVRIPSVVAYDAPGTLGADRRVFVQKLDLGDFEIASSSNDVLVAVDLSPVEAPPGCKFYCVNFEFDRVVRMRGLDIVALPPFQIQLEDVVLRVSVFGG